MNKMFFCGAAANKKILFILYILSTKRVTP